VAQKTHPIGFRLGIVKDWQARWFAGKQANYRALVLEDVTIRKTISKNYPEAGISRVEIERGTSDVIITIHTARPGIVIGRGGQRVEEIRKELEALTDRKARLNVQEIRQPELDAFLVARNIADQLERRIAFRRAIRQSVTRTMQAGAKGIKVICGGRLGGADIARTEKVLEGRVPLHTLRADIDYRLAEAATEFGRIGVRVWIYKGDILPAAPIEIEVEEEISPIEVTLRADSEQVDSNSDPSSTELSNILISSATSSESEPPKPGTATSGDSRQQILSAESESEPRTVSNLSDEPTKISNGDNDATTETR